MIMSFDGLSAAADSGIHLLLLLQNIVCGLGKQWVGVGISKSVKEKAEEDTQNDEVWS